VTWCLFFKSDKSSAYALSKAKKDLDVIMLKEDCFLIPNKRGLTPLPALGTFAVDEYSLKGLVKAYSRMKKICS